MAAAEINNERQLPRKTCQRLRKRRKDFLSTASDTNHTRQDEETRHGTEKRAIALHLHAETEFPQPGEE
jgi:hypothetical protein